MKDIDKVKLAVRTTLFCNKGTSDIGIFGVHKITYNWLTQKVKIYTSRPGIVIGRQGKLFYELKHDIQVRLGKRVKIEIIDYEPF